MKNAYLFVLLMIVASAATVFTFQNISFEKSSELTEEGETEEEDKRTRINDVMQQWFEMTKDPALGYPPRERLWNALNYIENAAFDKNTPITQAKWKERGPYRVGGRTRTLLIDGNDPNGRAAFAAGVAGGLWYTKDILAARPEWEVVDDYLENLAIVTLVQDPSNPQIMYFGTGEGYFNADALRGLGIFKSTDGGQTWNRLPATSPFAHTMRMAVHPNGDVYAATRSNGLQRSQDGGQTWQKVLGIGVSMGSSNSINEVEIGTDGSVWTITGYRSSTFIYKSEGGANVGDIGNWTRVGYTNTGFPGGQDRVELAVAESNPDVCYALCSNGNSATFIYKTTNGGQSWSKASDAPEINGNNFSGNQAWYDLDIDVDPTNENRVVVGGIDIMMSTTGGVSWSVVTHAYGNAAPYIHPDQHVIYFYPGRGDILFIGNDGGLYRSFNSDDFPSLIRFNLINDRYNVTQYYSCAIHPGFRTEYFIGGTQDNGTHAFDSYGMDDVDHIWGGDGMACHIDQTDGMIQIVSSQRGNYGLSFDGGQNFSGGVSVPDGQFYNPSDYDDEANIMYAQTSSNSYFRWEVENGNSDVVALTGGNIGTVTSLYATPNVPNRLYLGTSSGRIVKIDNAHTGTSKSYTQSSVGGSVSSVISERGNENHMLATVSNYGNVSVFESFDNGVTWQSVEGNLPDMPVWDALFDPINPDQAMIATEAGVWVTDNLDGANTIWQPSLDGMPVTRVDMLQYRESDNMILAGTHGRGMFTTDYRSPASAEFVVDEIGYVGTPFSFENRSYNPNKVEWDFGDGNTSTDDEPVHSYEQIGSYTVNLTINDTLFATKNITILPNRNVPYTTEDNTNYDGSFEDNAGEFGVFHVSGTSWERGSSTVNGKNDTKTGDNAYVTGINENFYQNNSESYLYTPNYDISQEGIYELSFWAKYSLQFGWDGFLVEYSTDLGANWSVLGGEDDDWYNYTNTNTPTAFLQGTSYFTGSQNTFKQYKIDLSSLVGNENVAFRIVFKTNNAGIYQGVAIDDFKIRAYIGSLETKLIDFTAEFIGAQQAEVNWSTLPEYECDGFELELSENGRDFGFFGFIDGQGSSINLTNYEYRPNNLRKDLYFMRLKVLNFDGSYFYSNTVVLQRKAEDLAIINTFPNPFVDKFGITFNNIVNEAVTINVYDATGKLLMSETESFEGIYKEIDATSLSRGVYIVQVLVGNQQFTQRLVKQN
jgi:photosystem II stability/assembly factor-like uncharacterized protein/PKD repeat protein